MRHAKGMLDDPSPSQKSLRSARPLTMAEIITHRERTAERTDECHACGKHRVMTWETNYQQWLDQLERCEGFVCDDCLSLGWRDGGFGR